MRKNIRFYTVAAIIVIFAGVYLFHLPYFFHKRNLGDYTFQQYFPYFVMALTCFWDVIKIVTGKENDLMKYGKLTEEEKDQYNISKVRKTQILYFLSFFIVIVFSFVFSEIYPNVIPYTVIIGCYLVELGIALIFEKTNWILNCFCRKD